MSRRRTIDLDGVRRARERLDRAVQRWPELTSPETRARLETYLNGESTMATTTKKKADTTKGETTQVAIRLDADTLARLDALAARLSRPGLALTRTDAIRIALATGLDAAERDKR